MRAAIARLARWLVLIALGACAIAACMSLVVLAYFRMALPTLDGEMAGPGLYRAVTIQRDHYGIVAIDAASLVDALWALGYAHAQDRFFQMDLARRSAAGELAEILGPAAFPADRNRRFWHMRSLARQQLDAASASQRSLLQSYRNGVNAGLTSLHVWPVEYLILRKEPRPWQDEDTLLTVHEMFFTLTRPEPERRMLLAMLKQRLPANLYGFLTTGSGEWDSALLRSKAQRTALPIPDRTSQGRSFNSRGERQVSDTEGQIPGSSALVVSSRKTVSHRSLLAVDMHLRLSIPNTWYRAQLRFGTAAGTRSVYGITLPGFPGFAVGSNQDIAWGLSNSQGQWTDALQLEPCRSAHADGYMLDGQCVAYGRAQEIIKVDGEPDRVVTFRTSVFGTLADGADAVVPQWLGARHEATNLHYLDMIMTRTVDAALAVAARSGLPPANIVVAGRDGDIGWTIAGQVPVWSTGCDAPVQLANRAEAGWRTVSAPDRYPTLHGDVQDVIVTANQRILPGDGFMCDGGFDIGARAQRIENLIAGTAGIDESALWRIQLDSSGFFLERWRRLLLELLEMQAAANPLKYSTLRHRLQAWGDGAVVGSVGYRFVREFRDVVVEDVLALLGSEAGMSGEELRQILPQREYPVWRLVHERPGQWVPAAFPDWDSYLLGTVDQLLRKYRAEDPELRHSTWGDRNVLRMEHALFGDVPLLGRLFRVPSVALPGDANMPRVQAPSFGASQRLVVSPGAEQQGLLSMPGGQSANPLSPFFDRGHDNWVNGRAQPLLAGPAEHTLRLRPDR